MDKQAIENKFGDFSSALKQKFAGLNLTDEEIKKALKNPDDLVSLVSAKTGISREEADKRVHQVMSTVGIDDATVKGFMEKWGDKVGDKLADIKNKLSH
ncbi:hypothetical protein EZJ49_14725 [Bdellovibrio bacteriovorus]|uniref:hypothetical protein n=1 Tax=Bdellovibrio bacteriovorus TaxID=959 RepID=UPI0021D1C625|nr:hypothetical protein [Bdellovibrio bacteriovorus]UXR64320.1 hypothetical protein EZJ49_14725 [Bdellovibrio bacteriovorus]